MRLPTDETLKKNITMKKINIIASLLLGGLLFTACDSDRDDNPTLVMPSSFELYAPADAENNTLDLLNSSTVDFTANQPDFGGFPVATTYTLQISLDSVFTDADEATGTTQNYADLSTTFTQPTMSVKASELNESMINLYETIKNTGSYDNAVRPLYVRCKANISTVKGSDVYSNVVELPNVLATYKAPDVTLPTDMYLCGSSIGTAWKTWQHMAPVYGATGQFYTLIYVPAGGAFKWGLKEEDWHGASEIATIDDQAGAGVSASSDDNLVFANAGWYTIKFTTKIRSNKVQYTMIIGKGDVKVTGASVGSFDTPLSMTAPADQTGDWTFNGFTAKGELRAYIVVPGSDWWRTEFTIQKSDNTIYYRTIDIPHNWMESKGDGYSVTAEPGKTLKVNFDKGTASLE